MSNKSVNLNWKKREEKKVFDFPIPTVFLYCYDIFPISILLFVVGYNTQKQVNYKSKNKTKFENKGLYK